MVVVMLIFSANPIENDGVSGVHGCYAVISPASLIETKLRLQPWK
jgi:hypothetical protein